LQCFRSSNQHITIRNYRDYLVISRHMSLKYNIKSTIVQLDNVLEQRRTRLFGEASANRITGVIYLNLLLDRCEEIKQKNL